MEVRGGVAGKKDVEEQRSCFCRIVANGKVRLP